MTVLIMYIVCLSVIRACLSLVMADCASCRIIWCMFECFWVRLNQQPRNRKGVLWGMLSKRLLLNKIWGSGSEMLLVARIDLDGLVVMLVN